MSFVRGLVSRLAIDPRQNTRVYAAIGAFPAGPSVAGDTVAGDILVSTNNGIDWTSIRANMPRTSVNTIIIDPTSLPPQFNLPAQTLFAGTGAGVFVSFDAGNQWTDLSTDNSTGLPPSPITDLALRQPDGILVAATFGRGVYRTSVSGLMPGIVAKPLSKSLNVVRGATADIGIAIANVSSTSSTEWQLNSLESWLSVPAPNGRLRVQESDQIPIHVSATALQRGTYIGRLQLTSASRIQNIFVELNVMPVPAEMTIVNSETLKGRAGSTLQPLQVLVADADHLPLEGIAVTFRIAEGGGSLTDGFVVTNSAGLASTRLTLPANPGTVQVVAAAAGLSATFTAMAVAAPSISTDSVFDAVTFAASTSFGPGAILAIFGENLAMAAAAAGTSSLPASLQDAQVLLTTAGGDVALPLFSASPQLLRALLPRELPAGKYKLHTELGSERSNEVEISVAAFDPGIFSISGNGRGPGIFIKDDGTAVSTSNPADRGSRVTFYASGLGAVNPAVPSNDAGATAEPFNRTVASPRVSFDRYSANVIYSGLAPGIAGRYQITVQVPAFVSAANNVSVSLTIGTFTSNRVTIPVR